uniref:Uncharacterized protein n=1 Tax=Oryza barthii TaxID=65489 RepID=A0A0D3FKJ8_9ORYZ
MRHWPAATHAAHSATSLCRDKGIYHNIYLFFYGNTNIWSGNHSVILCGYVAIDQFHSDFAYE